MRVMKVHLDNDFINDSNGSSSVSAAVPSSGNPSHNEAQTKELESIKLAFIKLEILLT